ncbi:cupin domain-containing protein [Streptomyces sp. NPDC004752]
MPKITKMPRAEDVLAEMRPSHYVTADALRSGSPNEQESNHLTSSDGRLSVGTWRAEPYSEYIDSYPGDEYTRILEGRVTLVGDDGETRTFTAGDAFVIAAGWRGEYRVDETLLKQFAFYCS